MTDKTLTTRFKPEGGLEIIEQAKAIGNAFEAAGAKGAASIERAGQAADRTKERYRAMAEAALQQADQQRNQADFNRLLGVVDPATFSGSAKAAAGAFDDLIAKQDEMARKAKQVEDAIRAEVAAIQEAGAQRDFNRFLGVDPERGRGAAAASAKIFEDYQRDAEIVERKLAEVKAALDPVAAAQDRYNKEVAELNRLKPHMTVEQHAQALQHAKQRFDDFERSQRSNRGAQITSQQLGNLSFQLNDIATGLLTGQSPFMIMAQQGGQVYQALQMGPGGVGGSIQGLIKLIGPLNLGFMGLATVATLVALKMHEGAEEGIKYQNSLLLTGNAAALTTAQLYETGDVLAAQMNMSAKSIREIEGQVVSSAKVVGDNVGLMTEAAALWAKATGDDAAKAVSKFLPLADDTTSAVVKLNGEFNSLTLAQIDQIRTLEESGDRHGALKLALDGLLEPMRAQHENLGILEQAWRNLSLGIGAAMDAMARFGRTKTDDDRNAKALKDINDQIAAMEGMRNAANPRVRAGFEQRGGQEALDLLYARKRGYDELSAATDMFNQKEAERDRLTNVVAQAEEKYQGRRTKLLAEEAELRKALSQGIGDKAQVEKLLAENKKAQDALDKSKTKRDRHAESLAREAEAMRLAAAETWKIVEAYKLSDEQVILLTARRDAMMRATRRGADVEAAVRAEINKQVAEQALSGARLASEQQKEAAAIYLLTRRINDEGMARAVASQLMTEERQMRGLVAMAAVAEGDAKARLLEIMQQLQKSNADLRKAQEEDATSQDNEAVLRNIALLEKEIELIGKSEQAQREAMARAKAIAELKARKYSDEDIQSSAHAVNYIENKVRQANLESARVLKTDYDNRLKDYHDAVELANLELSLNGKSSSERDKQLALERLKQDLIRQGYVEGSKELADLLEKGRALQDLDDQLDRVRQLRQAEDQALSNTFDSWKSKVREGQDVFSSFEDAVVEGVRKMVAELLIMATINPLQNMLMDTNLPTLSDVLGRLGGGKKSGSSSFAPGESSGMSDSWWGKIFGNGWRFPSYDKGTDSAPGGWSMVHADELMKLPAGTQVKTAARSAQMMKDFRSGKAMQVAQAPIHQHFHLHAEGAVMTSELMAKFEAKANEAASKRVSEAMEQMDQYLPDRVQQISNDPRLRRR